MKAALERACADEALLEIGRLAVEDALIEMRDARLSLIGRGNGLVIRERDGSESSIIRLGTKQALAIGLAAMAQRLGRGGISRKSDLYNQFKADCETRGVSMASTAKSLINEFLDALDK